MKVTFNLPDGLVDQLKDAVVYIQVHDTRYSTMSSVVEWAISNHLRTLRTRYKVGIGFPKRKQQPRSGRPIK